jgi:muramoyltetrapeptide carboxypeptidase
VVAGRQPVLAEGRVSADHPKVSVQLRQGERSDAMEVQRFDVQGVHASYVWSYLQVLRHAGILDRIAGMVVGIPTAIDGLDSPDASPTLQEIVLDVLGDRDIPVLGNVDVGHAGPNLPMPVGTRVALDARQRTLSLLEPAVRPLTVTGLGG